MVSVDKTGICLKGLSAMHTLYILCKQVGNQLILKRTIFEDFGKDALVAAKVNPDTFVQMCIQLAYIKLHKKPGNNLCLHIFK